MTERYEKWGTTVRWSRNRTGESRLQLEEHGIATATDSLFESHSLPLAPSGSSTISVELPSIGLIAIEPFVERFVLTGGVATHQLEGGGTRRSWTTNHQRLHLALRHGAHRVELHLGTNGDSLTAITDTISATAAALASSDRLERTWRTPVVLEPGVAAGFWKTIFFSPASRSLLRSGLVVEQRPRHATEVDGNGQAVLSVDLSENERPPNVFRPSYRTPPVRLPLNLSVTHRRDRVEGAIRAIAFTHPPELTLDGFLETGMLCVDAVSGRSFRASVQIPPGDFCERIEGISRDLIWYPEMAGIFGSDSLAELELRPGTD